METPSKAQLYQVRLLVRPTVEHKLFYDIEGGVLCMWLFASHPEAAKDKAMAIVEQLPYELVENSAMVYDKPTNPNHRFSEAMKFNEDGAKKVGFAIFLAANPTGGYSPDSWADIME